MTLRAALGYASGPMRTRHVLATCCAVLLAAGCQQAKEQAGTEAARDGEKLLVDILGRFALGDRELKGEESFTALRAKLDDAIEKLR